jgi:hypothetical protein
MKRIDPNFRFATLSDEETESFLDELFTNLFDSDDLSSDSDKTPDLSILDR